jgi:hypothetical protein
MIYKTVLVFAGIYAILVWNFGWGNGSIAFGAFMVIFLIASGAGTWVVKYFKDRKKIR